jgi:hypothetical protein
MKAIVIGLFILMLCANISYAQTQTALLSEDTLATDTEGLWGKITVTMRLEPQEGEKLLSDMQKIGRARIMLKGSQILYLPSASERITRLESVKALDDGKLWFIDKKSPRIKQKL